MENRGKAVNRSEFLILSAGAVLSAGVSGGFRPDSAGAEPVPSGRRMLGKTGLEVSPLALGAGRITDPEILRRALGHGVNAIDTGRRYMNGRNEEMIGRVIRGVREGLVISSKLHSSTLRDSKAMARSLEESLRALRTDYLDVLYIHGATSVDEIRSEQAMDFFALAKRDGKIRACGFSSHQNHLHLLRDAVREPFYDVVMIPYNHAGMFDHTVYGFHAEWNQKAVEREMEKAVALGMGIVAMKTCSGGPYREPGESRPTYLSALRWVLKNPRISTMAVALANFEEMEENLRVLQA